MIAQLFKKRAGNEYKAMFEQGMGVLHLEWCILGHGDEQGIMVDHRQWFHIPFANQSSWAVALLELKPSTDPFRIRLAKACDAIALRAAPDGLDGNHEKNPFTIMGIE